MKKPHISAMEWYQLDAIDRESYTPRKLTYEELKELNRISQLQLKREIMYTIDKARLQYAVETTSAKKRRAFLKKYGGANLGKKNKALVITEEARIKYSVSKAADKYYGITRIKARTGKGSRGGIKDVGWFIKAAMHANVNKELLDKLDILATNLTFSELQQLYAEMPDLDIYYPKDLDKRSSSLEQELESKLESAIYDMLYELEKDKPNKASSIWEAFDEYDEDPSQYVNEYYDEDDEMEEIVYEEKQRKGL